MTRKSSGAMSILSGGLTEADLQKAIGKNEAQCQDDRLKDSDHPEYDPDKIYSIDTKKVVPWEFADRPQEQLGDMAGLIRSISSKGQQQPVLLRPVSRGGVIEFELIFGQRRWRACCELEIPVQARIVALNNQAAFSVMSTENSDREDISTYSRAISYKNAISEGVFKNASALASSCGLDRSTVRDILYYMDLPEDIQTSVDLHKVGKHTVKAIRKCLLQSDKLLPLILAKADQITAGEFGPKKILSLLDTKQPSLTKPKIMTITNNKGTKFFSVSEAPNGKISISLLKDGQGKVSAESIIDRLKQLISE